MPEGLPGGRHAAQPGGSRDLQHGQRAGDRHQDNNGASTSNFLDILLDNAEAIILDVTAVGSSEQCLDHLLSVNSFGQVVPEVFLVRKEDGKRNTVVDNTPHALRHGNRGHDMIRDQLTMIFHSVRNVTQYVYAAGPLLLNNGLIYCEPVAVFC